MILRALLRGHGSEHRETGGPAAGPEGSEDPGQSSDEEDDEDINEETDAAKSLSTHARRARRAVPSRVSG